MAKNIADIDYKKFAKWANRYGASGLVNCSSGNLSYRVNEETILVSESRQWLSQLKTKHIVSVNLIDGLTEESKKPTGELPMHLAIMRLLPQINVVLHCQSPSATAIACRSGIDINYNVIIEIPIYIGKVAHLPYLVPGSEALGKAVADTATDASVIQLQNHGQIITGASFKEVYQKAIFFELACDIILKNNYNTTALSKDESESLKGYR